MKYFRFKKCRCQAFTIIFTCIKSFFGCKMDVEFLGFYSLTQSLFYCNSIILTKSAALLRKMSFISEEISQSIERHEHFFDDSSFYPESSVYLEHFGINQGQHLAIQTDNSKTIILNGRKLFPHEKKRLFKNLLDKVKKLREEKDSIQEQIDFMLLNFSYILQLLSQNLSGSVCDIFRSMSKQMNHKIQKVTSMLNGQKWQESLNRKYKQMEQENDKLKTQLKEFVHKYQNLLHQTEFLKDELIKVKEGLNSQPPLKSSYDSSPREIMSFQSSIDRFSFQNIGSPFRVKKTNTLNFYDSRKSSEFTNSRNQMNPNVKSLDKIKEKIKQLKDELRS